MGPGKKSAVMASLLYDLEDDGPTLRERYKYKVTLEDPTEPETLKETRTLIAARTELRILADSESALHKPEYEHHAIEWDNDGYGFWVRLWDGRDGYKGADTRCQAHVGIDIVKMR